METSIIVFLVLFTCHYAFRLYNRYICRKYQLNLFALRDKVRDYAIENKIDSKGWVFDFLDTSISKSVHEFRRLNIWYTIHLAKVHRSDAGFEKFKENLRIETNNNKYIKELTDEYNKILYKYVMARHIPLVIITFIGMSPILLSVRYFRKLKSSSSKTMNSLLAFPEITTSYQYTGKMAMVRC